MRMRNWSGSTKAAWSAAVIPLKSGTKSRSRKSVTLPLREEDSPPFWAENRKINVIQAATAPHSRQRRRSRFLFISDLGHQAADLSEKAAGLSMLIPSISRAWLYSSPA